MKYCCSVWIGRVRGGVDVEKHPTVKVPTVKDPEDRTPRTELRTLRRFREAVRSSRDSRAGRRSPGRLGTGWVVALFVLVSVVALLVRLPILYNADVDFNSDEAINSLVLRHLVLEGEVSLHAWQTTYIGIVESLLALPWVAGLGFHPLAFKITVVTTHLFAMVAVFFLARRVFDTVTGLKAVALLAVFSPQAVQWSTLANGGYPLCVALGAWSLTLLLRLRESSRFLDAALLGFTLGLGLYTHGIFVVSVGVLGAAGWVGSHLWFWLWGCEPPCRQRRSPVLSWQLRGLVAGGLLLGLSPRLWILFSGISGSRTPGVFPESLEQVGANASLLFTKALPAFLGIDLWQDPEVCRLVGPVWPSSCVLGAAFAALLLLGFVRSLWVRRGELVAWLGLRPVRLSGEAILGGLGLATLGLFILSPNAVNAMSNRYLMPLLTVLPILTAARVLRPRRLRRRPRLGSDPQWEESWIPPWGPGLGAASRLLALALLLGYPLVQTYHRHLLLGYLEPGLRLAQKPDAVGDLIGLLEERRIQEVYSTYWIAYKLTFRSEERIVATVFRGWDRYPPYKDRVNRAKSPGYVFPEDGPRARFLEGWLRKRSEAAGPEAVDWEKLTVEGFVVFWSPTGERLFRPE